MRELRPGLWHWEAQHPDWEGSVRWGQVVSSYAIDDGARLLLFDPIAPPSEIDDLAAIDFGHGLEISPAEWLPEVEWLPPGVTREQIAEALRPLLALPVEHVLATHGGPTDRAALERALSFS